MREKKKRLFGIDKDALECLSFCNGYRAISKYLNDYFLPPDIWWWFDSLSDFDK